MNPNSELFKAFAYIARPSWQDEAQADTARWFDECNPAIYTEFELEQMALLDEMKERYGKVPCEL